MTKGGTSPATTECVVCREAIRVGATVCTQCKSPQNWSRHVVMWKDLGTAFLALVPLWGGAIALWSLAFRNPVAMVRAVAPVCERSSIVLALANDGEATAVLKRPTLKVTQKVAQSEQTTTSPIELQAEGTAYPYLLLAKQSISVNLKPRLHGLPTDLPKPTSQNQGDCRLTIEIEFQAFDGRQQIVSAPCQCPVIS